MKDVATLRNELDALLLDKKYQAIVDAVQKINLQELGDKELDALAAQGYNGVAVTKYNNGEIDAALADYDMAIKLKPDFNDALYSRGVLWDSKKEYDKAIEDYTKAIAFNEADSEAWNSRGVAWYEKGEYNKAIEDYSKAVSVNPDYAAAYTNRAYAWDKLADYDKAIEDYTKVITLKPESAETYNGRGVAKDRKGQYKEAIEDYTQAIIIKSDYSIAYTNRAYAWDKLADYDKAIEDYGKVIALKPDSAEAYNSRGVAKDRKGQYKEAIEDYTQAINIKPDYGIAYSNRGYAWEALRDYDNALADYTRAIAVNHEDAGAYYYRGIIQNVKGEYRKAIDDYKAAIDLNESKYSFLEKEIKLAEEKIYQVELSIASDAKPEDVKLKQKIESEIEAIIKDIRIAAGSKVKTVVHYTSLEVATIFVKTADVKMRYSNAIYMNDPMEGKVLIEFLNDKEIRSAYENGERRNGNTVYLGSFLPATDDGSDESNEDKLLMWRTYGKDRVKGEAAGCSVVISSDFFRKNGQLNNFNDKNGLSDAEAENTKNAVFKSNDTQELLTVFYVKKEPKNDLQKIVAVNADVIEALINKLKMKLKGLLDIRAGYPAEGAFYRMIDNTVFNRLSQITYLFKSADYSFENEVRIIINMPKDLGFVKSMTQDEPGKPPKRFYIESENFVLPHIKKIYLGPRVDNHQQWSLFLDYEIGERANDVKRMESPLYKLVASEIAIMKSENKFQ
jgi:tetratricopeptide (TPR) repeat protein